MFLNTDNNGNKIEDFLKSMNFLAPNGQNLKYFIVPVNQNNEMISTNAVASGFEPLANENQVEGVTDNIVYARKDFKDRQSVSHPNFDPTAVPEEFPITKELDVPTANSNPASIENTGMKTDVLIAGGQIMPPGSGIKVVKPDANIEPAKFGNMPKPVAIPETAQGERLPIEENPKVSVLESTEKCLDFILNESIDMFPRNTLFHIVKD